LLAVAQREVEEDPVAKKLQITRAQSSYTSLNKKWFIRYLARVFRDADEKQKQCNARCG